MAGRSRNFFARCEMESEESHAGWAIVWMRNQEDFVACGMGFGWD
jgi:hypothetical protein